MRNSAARKKAFPKAFPSNVKILKPHGIAAGKELLYILNKYDVTDLSLAECKLLEKLTNYINENFECNPSQNLLAKRLKRSTRTIMRYMSKLIKLGYVTIITKGSNFRSMSNLYQINAEKIRCLQPAYIKGSLDFHRVTKCHTNCTTRDIIYNNITPTRETVGQEFFEDFNGQGEAEMSYHDEREVEELYFKAKFEPRPKTSQSFKSRFSNAPNRPQPPRAGSMRNFGDVAKTLVGQFDNKPTTFNPNDYPALAGGTQPYIQGSPLPSATTGPVIPLSPEEKPKFATIMARLEANIKNRKRLETECMTGGSGDKL